MNELLIEKLSNKLGVASEFIWEALIKQAFVNGVISLIFAAAIAAFVGWSYGKVQIKTKDACYGASEIWAMFWLMVFIAAFPLSYLVMDGISSLLNPEFWALKTIRGC